MQGGEYLARGSEEQLKVLKTATLKRYETNKLTKETLELIIDEAFQLGHYAGHLRGELYVHNLYREVTKKVDIYE